MSHSFKNFHAIGIGGWLFGAVFVGFWSLITLIFDSLVGYSIVQQVRTLSFAEEQGSVLESRIVTNHDSDGNSYRPYVRYEFFVSDDRFEGEVIRYGLMSSNDSFAADFVKAHPVNSSVTVFYAKNNPQDSVLLRGLQGSDLFLPMFLVPFNLIMLTGWYFGVSSFRKAAEGPGFQVLDDGHCVRVKLHRISPLFAGAITLGGLSFVSVFIVGFTAGFHASLPTMLGVWSVLILSTLSAMLWSFSRNLSGKYDLVLDRFRDELTLPVFKERKEPRTIKLSDIQQAKTKTREEQDSDGDWSTNVTVLLESKDESKDESIAEFSMPKPAHTLCDWLNEEWFASTDVR